MRTLADKLKLIALAVVTGGLVAPSLAEDVPVASTSLGSIYGNFYYHSESRELTSLIPRINETNLEFSVGYDYLLNADSLFYVGARAGIYEEQVLTSLPVGWKNSRPFFGGQGYKLIPFEKIFSLKLGAAADFIVAPRGSDFPVWLYVGALTGLRANLTDAVYFEAPVELGVAPFFDGLPIFFKIGAQLGFKI